MKKLRGKNVTAFRSVIRGSNLRTSAPATQIKNGLLVSNHSLTNKTLRINQASPIGKDEKIVS